MIAFSLDKPEKMVYHRTKRKMVLLENHIFHMTNYYFIIFSNFAKFHTIYYKNDKRLENTIFAFYNATTRLFTSQCFFAFKM